MATVERSLAGAPPEAPGRPRPGAGRRPQRHGPGGVPGGRPRVVDRIADYLADVERYPVLPADRARHDRRAAARRTRPRRPRPIDAILADVDRLVVPNATHWQHPGFFAYFATDRVRPRHPGRVPHRRARPEPDAVADVADRHGARGRGRRLAARGAGPAGRVRRPAHRHGLHVHADRPRGGARGGGARRRRAGLAGRRTCPRSGSTRRPRPTARSRRRA